MTTKTADYDRCPILGLPTQVFKPLDPRATVRGKPYKVKTASGGGSTRGSHTLSDALVCDRKVAFTQLGCSPLLPEYITLGSLVHERASFHFAPLVKFTPDWWDPENAEEMLKDALLSICIEDLGRPDRVLIEKSEEIWKATLDWLDSPEGAFNGSPAFVENEIAATLAELGAVDPASSQATEVVTVRMDFVRVSRKMLYADDYKVRGCRGVKGKKTLYDFRRTAYETDWQAALTQCILQARLQPTYSFAGFCHNRIGREAPYPCDRNLVQVRKELLQAVPQFAARAVDRHNYLSSKVDMYADEIEKYRKSGDRRESQEMLTTIGKRFLPSGTLTGACWPGGQSFKCRHTGACWGF